MRLSVPLSLLYVLNAGNGRLRYERVSGRLLVVVLPLCILGIRFGFAVMNLDNGGLSVGLVGQTRRRFLLPAMVLLNITVGLNIKRRTDD